MVGFYKNKYKDTYMYVHMFMHVKDNLNALQVLNVSITVRKCKYFPFSFYEI